MKGITINFEGLDEKQTSNLMLELRKIKGLPEPTRWTGEVERVKQLPRDEKGNIKNHFVANGVHYNIVEAIGIERWTKYEQYSVSVGAARTFQGIYDGYGKCAKIMNTQDKAVEERIFDLNVHVKSQQDSIIDFSEERINLITEMATVFIIRDGGNVATYNHVEAEEDVENWTKEGIDVKDFFFLSMKWENYFISVYNKTAMEMGKAELIISRGDTSINTVEQKSD